MDRVTGGPADAKAPMTSIFEGGSVGMQTATETNALTASGVAVPPAEPLAASHIAFPTFPAIGIGGSAGGLAAFEAFFAGLPGGASTGMAYVLVQHLAPDYKSVLADLVGRCTELPVCEVEDGMSVEPDHVYVIPPGRDMAQLNDPHTPDVPAFRGQRSHVGRLHAVIWARLTSPTG